MVPLVKIQKAITRASGSTKIPIPLVMYIGFIYKGLECSSSLTTIHPSTYVSSPLPAVC